VAESVKTKIQVGLAGHTKEIEVALPNGDPVPYETVDRPLTGKRGPRLDGPQKVTGRALYNVLPETAGPYFSKLECFCFKNQTLKPGESMEFPVVYTVDPRYAADRDNKSFGEITLSYTFFPATNGARAERKTGGTEAQ